MVNDDKEKHSGLVAPSFKKGRSWTRDRSVIAVFLRWRHVLFSFTFPCLIVVSTHDS